MADRRPSHRADAHPSARLLRTELALSAVAIGAITGAVAVAPAVADDEDFPSWQEVQQARDDVAATAAEVERITDLLAELQERADGAGRAAAVAAEEFHLAQLAEQEADERVGALRAEAAAARRTAGTSRMRAGLLVAHLARTSGGGTLSLDLALNADDAADLLDRLATASHLTTQSQRIYREAVADEHEAAALERQAASAARRLEEHAEAARAAFGEAEAAAQAAGQAVEQQERHAARLVEQLASLQRVSEQAAAAYVDGELAERAAAAQDAADAEDPTDAEDAELVAGGAPGTTTAPVSTPAAPVSTPTAAPSNRPSTAPSSRPSAAPSTRPSPTTGARPASGSSSSGSASGGSAPGGSTVQPDASVAARAVAFARDQIGEPYAFGAAGPSSWDCSGLTMRAYSSAGLSIGGHSATAQYDWARSRGLLVPYAQAQPGDLVFWTNGGGDMYHVAIYTGGGMMVEAPYPGRSVREVAVRANQRAAHVARVSG